MTPSTRNEKYILRSFSDKSALLINEDGGDYFELNASACEAWQLYLQGRSKEEAAQILSNRYGRTQSEMKQVVDTILAVGSLKAPKAFDDYRVDESEPDTTVFEFLGSPVFILRMDGSVSAATPGNLPVEAIAKHLFTLIPNMLAYRGAVTLHGSAFFVGDALTLVVGESGAGKTTTARAFCEQGTETLQAEDKLVLGQDPSNLWCLRRNGERALSQWSERAAAGLHQGRAVSVDDLLQSLTTLPLDAPSKIWLLSKDNRRQDLLCIDESPPRTQALCTGSLLRQLFAGKRGTAERKLEVACSLADTRCVREIGVPNGLHLLASAVTDYISKMAS